MPVSSSLQDSTGTASVEEAQSGQGTDVQLPADIEPHQSFQGDRAAGSGQTEVQLLASPSFARLQSAYRRGHSTETALLHVMNSV